MPMIALRLVVGAAALLVAVVVVRNAAVDALSTTDADLAVRIWPGHPRAELARAMIDIARAAGERRAIPATLFERVDEAARKAPLAPEPFLVRGVEAGLAGNANLAEQAFLAAERRDPRSLPAHYFLAEQYFRLGDAERGLRQVVMLVNLAPGGVGSAAPYVAAYAGDRSHWPELRAMFRQNPSIEDASLITLATNAANADLILALASPSRFNGKSPWLPGLLNNLIAAGNYAKARAMWASASRVTAAPLLFDADFANAAAPPPFNWALTSSTVGLAERQAGGRLHVIYYGQEDGALARQLLILPAGRYRLSMRLLGDHSQAKALNWSVKCAKAQNPLAAISVDIAASRGMTFDVPPGCGAQWLELNGRSSDLPQTSDQTISAVRLDREDSSGQ